MKKSIISAAERINSIRLYFTAVSLLCMMLITVLPAKSSEILAATTPPDAITTTKEIPLEYAILIASLITASFFLILYLGWYKSKKIDKGVMRRAMAGTFVIGYTFLVMLSMWSGIFQKEIILMYIQLVSMVVAFYFGAKVGAEAPDSSPSENK